MNKLRRMLEGNSPAGNMLKLGGGTALGQVFSVLVMPIVSRQYDPIQRGHFGLFSAFIAVASVVVGLRYEMAIPTAASDEEADQLLALSLASVLLVSLLSGGVYVLLHILGLGGYGNLAGWTVWLLVAILLLTGTFSSLRFWLIRQSDFGRISKAMVHQGFIRSLAPVVYGFIKGDWIGLALGEVLGRTSGVFSLSRTAYAHLKTALSEKKSLLGVAEKHKSMPLQMLPSSLVDSLAFSITVPMFFSYYGGRDAGLYSMAITIIAIPSGLIAASVGDVYHQQLAELVKTEPGRLYNYNKNYSWKMLKIAMAIYFPCAALSYLLAEPVLGAKWATLSWMLPALVPMVILSSVCGPMSRVLVVVNRVDLKLFVDVVTLVLTIVPVILCAKMNQPFHVAFGAFCASMFIARLLYAWIILRACEPGRYRLSA